MSLINENPYSSFSQFEISIKNLLYDIIFDIIFSVSKAEKLLAKLKNESIAAHELRTLLGQLGWILARQKGSHEQWLKNGKVITLATHSKDLKPYQIKQVLKALEE